MVKSETVASLKKLFRSFPLKTQLLLIFLFLLLISISSLSIIYMRSEETLMEKMSDNIEDITKAIQISVEELTYRGDSTQRLKGYVDMFNKKGIKEISIMSDSAEVIASSDPKKIGTREKLSDKKTIRKKDLMITARLGEESKSESQRLYNIIVPVSMKGQNIGYTLISLVLDDYSAYQRRNHLKRILSTLFVFSIGIVFSLLIAERYAEPIKKISEASRKVAEGNLVKISDSERQDEIGVLIRSYNEMVGKLAERMELEEKLKKSEQLSIIGQLSSGIAHEIRNPLNFLSLSIGHIKERILEEEIRDKDDLVMLLDDLIKEIHKVNELIHNFLFLGKPITLRREWVMPETLVHEVLTLVKDKIREGIDIRLACTSGEPMYCDVEYVRICVMNLVLNAVQAIEGKGEISIACGIDDGFSVIAVSDTGGGVSDTEHDKIFEPYYSTKKFGIGLGLAITKRFIEEHGGTISIRSEIGKGTTMELRIPHHEV